LLAAFAIASGGMAYGATGQPSPLLPVDSFQTPDSLRSAILAEQPADSNAVQLIAQRGGRDGGRRGGDGGSRGSAGRSSGGPSGRSSGGSSVPRSSGGSSGPRITSPRISGSASTRSSSQRSDSGSSRSQTPR